MLLKAIGVQNFQMVSSEQQSTTNSKGVGGPALILTLFWLKKKARQSLLVWKHLPTHPHFQSLHRETRPPHRNYISPHQTHAHFSIMTHCCKVYTKKDSQLMPRNQTLSIYRWQCLSDCWLTWCFINTKLPILKYETFPLIDPNF